MRIASLIIVSMVSVGLTFAITGCGAKTGLRVRDVFVHDATDVQRTDVIQVTDCDPSRPECTVLRVACGAGATTRAGLTVTLEAMGYPVAPLGIVSRAWSVVTSPPGSSFAFSVTDASPTEFTADSAGAYVVRFTATDSAGRMAACDIPVNVGATYRGTEFWAASTTNSGLLGGDVFHFAVAVGNANPDPVEVTVTGGALTMPVTFSVPANTAITRNLPWVTGLSHNLTRIESTSATCCDLGCCQSTPGTCTQTGGDFARSTLVTGGAYRLIASAPVSMYQFNALEYASSVLCTEGSNSYTNDASLLLPTPALTGNYLVLSHNAMQGNGSFVAIAGTSDMPTRVRVRLSTDITGGNGVMAALAGTTQEYTLERGDVVQLISTSEQGGGGPGFTREDMTGTVIEASAPVAVWAGVNCTNMSWPDGTVPACDHIEQQLFPSETWGRDVVVSRFRDRGPLVYSIVRILSREDGNVISFVPRDAHASATLRRGEFLEFEASSDFEITATHPILVAQFMEGQVAHGGGGFGDPAFLLEVPAPQYRREYSFVVPSTYSESYITVVLHTGAAFSIDGRVAPGRATSIAGTPWSAWRGAITPGSHRVATTDAAGLGLKVIGVAPFTSYTYPGGLDLSVQP